MTTESEQLIVYIDILKKSKWIIIFFTLVCVLTVGTISFIKPHIYRASSFLLVDTESANILNMKDVVRLGTDSFTYTEYLNTQINILKSHSIIKETFHKCDLYRKLKEKYVSKDENPLRIKIRNVIKNFKCLIKCFFSSTYCLDNQIDDSHINRLKLMESFKKNLIIDHERETRLLQISYEHENPKLASLIVNAITDIYMHHNLKRKVETSKEALTWIKSEIEKIKDFLKEKEIKLQKFREENDFISDEQNRKVLNQAILILSEKIIEAESSFSKYSTKYTIDHPKIQQIKKLINNYKEDLKNKKKLAIENEEKFIKYNELKQDINISRSMLEHIMLREKETLISGSTNANNISVVEYAQIPYKPIRPKRTLNVIIALFIGCFAGCAWAFILEYFKKHVHSADDFLIYDIPFLGYIPIIKSSIFNRKKSFKDSYHHFNSKGIISEIFNNIRTSVILNADVNEKEKKGKSFVVTSFIPGEGKTLVSCNLACAFAKYNFKVLLIEGDLRKPRINKAFNIKSKKGLTDYLNNKVKLQNIIHSTNIKNLDVILAGSIPDNPSELLGSDNFKEFFNKLELKYEIIIVDSPPVLSVTDPIILSSIIKKTILISKYNFTPKHTIPLIKTKLDEAKTKIVGVIINQVQKIEQVSTYIDYYSYK